MKAKTSLKRLDLRGIAKLVASNIGNYVHIHEFRSGQQPFFEAIKDGIGNGYTAFYNVAPTGYGKTFIFSITSDALVANTSLRVLVVVPDKDLIHQTTAKIRTFSKLSVGKYYQSEKDLNQQVTVMTRDSLRNGIKAGIFTYDTWDIVIIDEAHQSLSKGVHPIVEEMKKYCLVIGFTASPSYSKEKSLRKLLGDFTGGEPLYIISNPEAIRMGILCGVQVILGKTKITVHDRPGGVSQQQYLQQMGAQITREGGTRGAAELYEQLFLPDFRRFIGYCVTIQHCKDFVEELRLRDIPAEVIDGDMSDEVRQDIYERFQAGEFLVLASVGVVMQGYDDEGLEGVIWVYPVQSIVNGIQGSGRSSRICSWLPYKIGFVVHMVFEGRKQFFYNDFLGDTLILPEESPTYDRDDYTPLDPASVPIVTNIEVVVEHEKIMEMMAEYGNQKEAPEGWRTARHLGSELNSKPKTIELFAENYRNSHSGCFRDYLSYGRIFEYYAPELVQIIREHFAKRKETPMGWVTASKILKEFGSAFETIKLFAEKYRKEKSMWFEFYLTGNRLIEHYHPELVQIIREYFAKRQEAPAGWTTSKKLGKELHSDSNTIKRFVKSNYGKNSEWFSKYRTGAHFIEHYHPDLVELIRNKFARKTSPDGWITATKLAKELYSDPNTIKDFVNRNYRSYPLWFSDYWTQSGNYEHYHPDLVRLIVDHFKNKKNS